jgi:hypothetical protein
VTRGRANKAETRRPYIAYLTTTEKGVDNNLLKELKVTGALMSLNCILALTGNVEVTSQRQQSIATAKYLPSVLEASN